MRFCGKCGHGKRFYPKSAEWVCVNCRRASDRNKRKIKRDSLNKGRILILRKKGMTFKVKINFISKIKTKNNTIITSDSEHIKKQKYNDWARKRARRRVRNLEIPYLKQLIKLSNSSMSLEDKRNEISLLRSGNFFKTMNAVGGIRNIVKNETSNQ